LMAYYLSREREQDVMAAYRRYQQYLQEHSSEFPPGALALGTSEWYQHPNDHRCPHDGRLDTLFVSEITNQDQKHTITMRVRLVAAYHDGFIEFTYPQVFAYRLESESSEKRPVDWLYDEFRLAENSHLIHEIEWASGSSDQIFRWTIEASDVQCHWIPQLPSMMKFN
jgi:hypothetical protein